MANNTTAAQFSERLRQNIDPEQLATRVDRDTEETLLTKPAVAHILEIISALIVDELDAGQDAVVVKGIGRIKLVKTPAKPRREVRNPATGEMIWADKKPAGVKVKILPEKALKDQLGAS